MISDEFVMSCHVIGDFAKPTYSTYRKEAIAVLSVHQKLVRKQESQR